MENKVQQLEERLARLEGRLNAMAGSIDKDSEKETEQDRMPAKWKKDVFWGGALLYYRGFMAWQ